MRRRWTDHHKAMVSFSWNAGVNELDDWLKNAREFEASNALPPKTKPEVKQQPEKRAQTNVLTDAANSMPIVWAGVANPALPMPVQVVWM